jgi:uncharacterized protein (TIGR03437 family)
VTTGAPSPSDPLPAVTSTYSVTVGGRPAETIYLGLTPTFVSLAQANVKIPDMAEGSYPLVITVDGEASNALQISVGR